MENVNTYGEEKRQELVVEMYMKKLLSAVDEIKEKICQIDQRLSSLEIKQNSAPIQPKENVPFQQPVQATPEPAKAEPVKAPASETNQRTGGFNSEDVSIEKFFYAGNK